MLGGRGWGGRPSAAMPLDRGVPFVVVQCAIGTRHLQEWQPEVHFFQQDHKCSIAAETFYLNPWKKIFQLAGLSITKVGWMSSGRIAPRRYSQRNVHADCH